MLSDVAMLDDADARFGRMCAPPSAATQTASEPGASCGPYWQYLKHCARSSQWRSCYASAYKSSWNDWLNALQKGP
ncbi:hypothetical protein MTO96_033268 [Rhipicephalus appendiculatus]